MSQKHSTPVRGLMAAHLLTEKKTPQFEGRLASFIRAAARPGSRFMTGREFNFKQLDLRGP